MRLDDERHGCIVRCGWWKCSTPFAICEGCDGGQKYCSDRCKDDAREEQVRCARRRYARSKRGKRTASWRNTDYRARRKQRLRAKSFGQIETDHPSTQDPPKATEVPDVKRATEGSPVRVTEGPCHDVDTKERGLGGELAPSDVHRQTRLEVCRFCGARIRLFVDRDTLRARIAARRLPSTPRRGRRPRVPVGPG